MSQNIRNFCIIAHIDHGKSTLADRFLEITGALAKRQMKHAQMLDTMELEQERGITIKLQPARMEYQGYILNLIDTPGHVDFSYEVSRSLAAVEGAVLVVDATQGIQAQTLANVYQALEHNLTIIPVVNKIDMNGAEPQRIAAEIQEVFGFSQEEIIFASAKTGQNVESILQAVIDRVPPPRGNPKSETKALVFDSFYDAYKGVVAYVRVVDGQICQGDKILFMASREVSEAMEIGHLVIDYRPVKSLQAGEIGYIATGMKKIDKVRVGDTITLVSQPAVAPLPGYKQVKPFVYAGIFCVDNDDFPVLRDSLQKLAMSDSSLFFEPENSAALGFGFRCGFLGLLHMDIVRERLEREYDLDLIVSTPNVPYLVQMTDGQEVYLDNPAALPDRSFVRSIAEPYIKAEVITPKEYIGSIMEICEQKRGKYLQMNHLDENLVNIVYEIPLAEVIVDFYDQLKSVSKGYGSFNYELVGYREGDLVKVDTMIAGERVDAFSFIVHRDRAYSAGLAVIKKLKEVIPRQNFAVALQAAIGGKIIAREDISAVRKDVTAKLYGGDRTRKDKLLKKQKAGKKKMKMLGRVEVPKEAFLAVLKR